VACVDQYGEAADLAKVAAAIGVTRQTVYRYFPTSRSLFEAVAQQRATTLVDRLIRHLDPTLDAADAVVEVVMFCLRTLPSDPQLAFVARPGRADALITASEAPAMALAVLQRLPIELGHLDADRLATLAELMVRLLQALLLDPATAGRDDTDLRRFLHACLNSLVHPSTIRR
jgi:AcrR family transcriptional regulator